MRQISQWIKYFSIHLTMMLFFTITANAATPVVNTTINLSKTGSEPFDTTVWDGADLTLAGTDDDENNDIVRMQDSVTYKVEVSVNDASVDNLVATVSLPDGKQKWITLPTGCETDATLFSPVSSISADGYTLTCNVGKAIEGTTKVFYPAAKVVSYNSLTDKPVLNNEHTIARVSATTTGANVATAGDTDVTITAGFKVDTIKTLKVPGLDKDGNPLYKSTIAKGPNGEDGYLIEYKINVKYANGSMLMDAPNEAGGDYEVDFNLFDIYTNDNPNSTGAAGNSSGGILYTWGDDGVAGGCSLEGDHGPNAAVACKSTNFDATTGTASTTAAFDGISPTNPATNQTDGIVDPNIEIALSGIDVRDPDADSNLVELNVALWFSKADDVASAPSCANAGGCTVFTVNSVGTLNGTSIEGFNPTSTEDASGNNLPNYAGNGEPTPNEIDFPLIHQSPGSWSFSKVFGGYWRATSADYWTADLEVSPGQVIQVGTNIHDHRANEKVGRTCDKIDTTQFEFLGLWDPSSGEDTIRETGYWGNYYPQASQNPRVHIYGGGNSFIDNAYDLPSTWTVLYSKVPVLAGGVTTPESAYLEALRGSSCDDDVDGDGQVRIKLKDGKVYDKTIGGTEITDGGPIDWYESTAYSVAGIDPDIQGQVTRVRQEYRTDQDLFSTLVPGYTYTGFYSEFDLKIKGDATGYGASHLLPNYMMGNSDITTPATYYPSVATADTNALAFSKERYRADRVKLVASSISIKKVTEPKGIKVVKAGDLVDFIITPGIWGLWTGEETATVSDAVPAGTKYVAGSEKFSIDGGVTWLSYDDYQALANPDVTLTSAAQTAGANPLVWEFGALTPKNTGSDQLPQIKYTVEVDPTATSASYTNTATLTSNIDNNNSASPVKAVYNIKVLPSSGFEVLKMVDQAVYNTNTPFHFDLVYKNLGGETYSSSQFIDILPHNADGIGTSGGLASARTPATIYSGSYVVSALSGTNSEVFEMTSADPTTIPQDPCHEDNLPNGYIPVAGDMCYNFYISSNTAGVPVKAANTFAGGAATGTGLIHWVPFVANTAGTTAIRFTVPSITASAGAKTVGLTLAPTGNKGGTPALDATGKVTAASTGDIYTNTFGGRVPEISLVVISNDVSVTVVSGSIGDYVWIDANGDGVQDAGETSLSNVTLKLLDGTGNPIYVDANGGIVPSGTVGAVPYTTTTGADGKYLFENLPSDIYTVEVDTTTLPAGMIQTYDADGIATANKSTHSLTLNTDPITGVITSVEDNTEQDFGYNSPPVSVNANEPLQLNPSGNTQVQVPNLTVSDPEDGILSTVKIETLPNNATLYYNGVVVTAGQVIPNFDNTKLTVDPEDGDQTVSFDYSTTDAGGLTSNVSTVTMPFIADISISGNIFNDGNGDADVNGTAIPTPDGTQLHATLLAADGVTVLATTPIAADGTYSFSHADGVDLNTSYNVVLATTPSATASDLPTNWNNTGENINSAGTGNDGTADGLIAVSVGTANVPQVDFGINKKPVAVDVTEPSQLNPGGSTQVQVPNLNVSDLEDGTPTTVTIESLPNNATLYYNGVAVTVGQVIPNFDNTKLTVNPIDGDQTVVFDYTTTDADGVKSDPATVTMPFTGLGISGNVFNDGDGDANVNGTPIPKPDGTQLHATLLAADGVTVVATTPIAADGSYSFTGADGVTANTSYTVVLATTPNARTSTLPTNWNNTGENINSAGAGNDGSSNGTIAVSVGTVGVPKIDFGINKKPVAVNVRKPIENNPGGNTKVPVPSLQVSDYEDGTPTTVTIKTLPSSGILYYNGVAVTVGQVIPNFNASKLTVDPNNGSVVITFAYTTTDAAGIESNPATVTMPFNGNGTITGNVSAQDNNGKLKAIANVTLVLYSSNGTEVARTTTDANGNYRFTAPPGNYYIQEAQPNGYYDVSENEGGADNESNNRLLNTINVTVGVGETDIRNDFVESTTSKGCGCRPTPVIPCTQCAQGIHKIHTHNVKDNSTEVHWADSYYEIAYDIYLNGKFITTVGEDVTRYTFTGLQTGTEYTAVIVANNGYGGKTKQTVKFKTTDSLGWLPAVYHILD